MWVLCEKIFTSIIYDFSTYKHEMCYTIQLALMLHLVKYCGLLQSILACNVPNKHASSIVKYYMASVYQVAFKA